MGSLSTGSVGSHGCSCFEVERSDSLNMYGVIILTKVRDAIG